MSLSATHAFEVGCPSTCELELDVIEQRTLGVEGRVVDEAVEMGVELFEPGYGNIVGGHVGGDACHFQA